MSLALEVEPPEVPSSLIKPLPLERAKIEAGRIWAEKDKRKAKWKDWTYEQIDALSPSEYQSLVQRELERMG